MWEAIESNRRRSWIFVSLMAVLLVGTGGAIGWVVDPRGAAIGAAAAAGLWLLLWLVAAFQGDRILLAASGARKVGREEAPQLWNVVEEMTIASGLGWRPDLYVVDDPRPNAYAVGRKKDQGAVAVTTGLARLLDRDELQGVIGHEIGHLKNRDVQFMILAGVMLGAVVLLCDGLFRITWRGGRRSRRGGGGGLILIIALVAAILAPLLARLLYFACSRRREFLADASSARFTRYPEGLASALEKISARAREAREGTHRVLAPLYIVNPLEALAPAALFSTHPPTEKRVRILREMAGGAGFGAYETSYRKVHGGGKGCLGARTLGTDTPVAIRSAAAEPDGRKAAADRGLEAVHALDRFSGYLLLTCLCGVGFKVPPDFQRDAIPCPRCGRINPLTR